jgi:hypothetical protein
MEVRAQFQVQVSRQDANFIQTRCFISAKRNNNNNLLFLSGAISKVIYFQFLLIIIVTDAIFLFALPNKLKVMSHKFSDESEPLKYGWRHWSQGVRL